MAVTSTLANTMGAAFLGSMVAAVLYGITNLQVYLYYKNYNNDWSIQKYSVALLWVLDTLHLSFTIAAMYEYLINSFGSLEGIQRVVWSFKLGITVNVVIICVVQSLYALRVWKLGRHYQRAWPIIVALIVASGYGIGIVLAVKTYGVTTFTELAAISWVIYASFAWSTAIDIVIAIAVCYYLLRTRSGFSGTNNKIVMIVRMVLASGCLTSACSLAALISFAVMPKTLVFLGIEFLLSKLYINSFLSMLNARQTIRDKDASTGGAVSVTKIMNVNVRTSRSLHVISSDEVASPYDLEEGKGAMPLSPLSPLEPYGNQYTLSRNPPVDRTYGHGQYTAPGIPPPQRPQNNMADNAG